MTQSSADFETLQGYEKRRYVGDMFARIARRYDLMNTLMTGGMHHRWRRVAARVATRGLEGMALDVATGTGDLAFALDREKGVSVVVGVDLLPEMIIRARGKAHALRPGSRVRFAISDALSLPFPDNTFACVTTGWGLRNMPDLDESLREMARVVRPGGRLVSLESMPPPGGPLSLPFRVFLHQVVPMMGRLVAGDREAYTYLPRSVDRFLTAEALARHFQEVGLREVGYRRTGLGAVAIHWGTVV